MLNADLKTQLKGHLERITSPIELRASYDDTPKSAELRELLEEIASLSNLITLVDTNDADRRPSFEILRVGNEIGVTFAGIPLGHEFTSLVLALLQVGGHPSTADAELLERVANLEGEFNFETYFSLSCQNCPDVVQALNLMSVINPNIKHTSIDGALFPKEVAEREVLAVPNVFLNGEKFDQGRMSLEEIVNKLDTNSGAKQAEALNAREPYEVLVIGGGPAGVAAAIYAARKGIRTGVVADRFGGQVLDTMSIENFVSVPHTDGPKFVSEMKRHVEEYPIELITANEAVKLEPADAPGALATVHFANGGSLKARSVILATGARWRSIGVPGEQEYRNQGVTYCPHCDGPLFANKPVAVVGGGNSGVEAAIDLAGVASHVTLVEFDSELRADEVLQAKLRSLNNVDVVVSALTTEIVGNGSSVVGMRYTDRETNAESQLDLSGVFVQIGLLPNTEWLADAVELTDRGEIIVDERGATSTPGIYAAGDCTTEPFKQIVVAMGAGATASLGAFDYLVRSSVESDSNLEPALA